MNRLFHTFLFLTLILRACSPSLSSPTPFPASDIPTSPPSDIAAYASITPDTSSINPCGYQWAYEGMPELTAQFDTAVKNLIPNSRAHATAFGENCIGNDGQALRFLAMETDFYVIVTTESTNDYETFGNWIAQVMRVVNELPHDLIVGPKSGFVEFSIGKDLSASIGIRVPIQQYNESANGKAGEELFRMFYAVP